MILLTHVQRKAKARRTLGGGAEISDLLFMDHLKLYEKNENEINQKASVYCRGL